MLCFCSPAPTTQTRPGMVVHAGNFSTRERVAGGPEVQDYSWLQKKFMGILKYMRFCLKQTTQSITLERKTFVTYLKQMGPAAHVTWSWCDKLTHKWWFQSNTLSQVCRPQLKTDVLAEPHSLQKLYGRMLSCLFWLWVVAGNSC